MPPNIASSFFSFSFLFLVSITLPNLLFLFIQATLGRITKAPSPSKTNTANDMVERGTEKMEKQNKIKW
jgi:hypothetical protein